MPRERSWPRPQSAAARMPHAEKEGAQGPRIRRDRRPRKGRENGSRPSSAIARAIALARAPATSPTPSPCRDRLRVRAPSGTIPRPIEPPASILCAKRVFANPARFHPHLGSLLQNCATAQQEVYSSSMRFPFHRHDRKESPHMSVGNLPIC